MSRVDFFGEFRLMQSQLFKCPLSTEERLCITSLSATFKKMMEELAVIPSEDVSAEAQRCKIPESHLSVFVDKFRDWERDIANATLMQRDPAKYMIDEDGNKFVRLRNS